MSKTQTPKPPYLADKEISHQLQRILDSQEFRNSPRQSTFLKFTVDQTLAGNTNKIKGYTVAIEVFGHSKDFDQRVNPIVSVYASRLRKTLERYYMNSGKHDPIRIHIPKGTYVPEFEFRQPVQKADSGYREHSDVSIQSFWPSILIRPLHNLSNDPELDFWGIGLATELAHELNRYPDIRVMSLGLDNPNITSIQHAARFVVDGIVHRDENCLKIILKLTDSRTGHQIWSDSYQSSIEAARLIAFQEHTARQVAINIAGNNGWIMRTLDKESKHHPPQHQSVYEAVLRYFEYDTTYTPEAFSRALIALEKAVNIDPEYGPAWSGLARLYADIYTSETSGFKDPLEKAFGFAQNGTRLSPNDQRCRTTMAYIHLFRNDLKAGLVEAEQALNLGPETLYMLDGIGYLMTLLGDWERGLSLIKKVMQLNPFYGNYVHFALWGHRLWQKDYDGAYQEALKLNRPSLFWDHAARAASLGLLGNIEDGRKAAAELIKIKPDFAERSRILIGHYIKFEDIAERVIEGLNAVGVAVK